ncbi:MAG: peptidylprolyl isomerase, partial [Chloroflexota bacterium]|nr:peptidylprolyl isomerase [Chloroflexota bacterium]
AQRQLAGSFGIAVGDADVEAEIRRRSTTPEAVRLSIIAIDALPEDAAPGDQPTEDDFERARSVAEDVLVLLEGGAEFAEEARTESGDPSAANGGDIGYVEADDARFADLFAAARGVAVGELAGPVRTATGYTILRVDDHRDEAYDPAYVDRFLSSGVERADYRAHVVDELMAERFRTYFAEHVAVSPQPQRRIAQILVAEQTADPVPERRVRHVLIKPLPDADDQTAATEEEWAAALERAEEVRAQLVAPDADWGAIAAAESGDPGTAQRGGDLGWVAVENPGFVEEFSAALDQLQVGEVSEPVRTQFGYHLIQIIDERDSAAAEVEEIVEGLTDDADSFADVARRVSEDYATAENGGEVGWVARWELDAAKEDAVFALDEVGSVSDPVQVSGEGTYLFRLLEIDPEREVEPARLETIRRIGYQRWIDSQEAGLGIWIDPQFQAPTAPTGA